MSLQGTGLLVELMAVCVPCKRFRVARCDGAHLQLTGLWTSDKRLS